MLFKQDHLEGIVAGKVSLAFRKWKQPAVKEGSLINTSVGVIEITEIIPWHVQQLSEEAAIAAGYKNLSALQQVLSKISAGTLYKIRVRYYAADPRIELREQTSLTAADRDALLEKLKRLDQYSQQGDWTREVLNAIQQYPHSKAILLAGKLGREKEWLKLNIRKLKNLGLTISHTEGYSLSPLGTLLLSAWSRKKK
ncbi:ASCH domain-containing protein [Chitinophaga arvensicola]|uniref:ASCH domain-containing protein n=1 Tax=Chitinophaga arvensicola TaxID=29529 RepID=A0A1I0S6U2_9BACT|nr:ASCH domain-containing protein [Chitinophaga arvensicola]SEW51423.1 hypothetical protein SAMN04488122_4235 [Chitinophaga arvensicola]